MVKIRPFAVPVPGLRVGKVGEQDFEDAFQMSHKVLAVVRFVGHTFIPAVIRALEEGHPDIGYGFDRGFVEMPELLQEFGTFLANYSIIAIRA